MAQAAHESLGPRTTHSFATTPPEHACDPFWKTLPGPVFPCDHPLPTPRNTEAARHAAHWVQQLPPNAVLAVLLSGGASAHLCSPAQGLSLHDITTATRHLQLAGANIHELNCVRRHCETLKGGGLARLAHPRRVTTYALSDVIGDPLHDIASGPTVPDPTTTADALAIADAYDLSHAAPRIVTHLRAHAHDVNPKPENTRATVIASNRLVAAALADHLRTSHPQAVELLTDVQASVPAAARLMNSHAARTASTNPKPFALIAAGEWTVDTRNTHQPGLGGPSQELALTIAHTLTLPRPWSLLTLSTDGRDGPTDHAGALITHHTAALARSRNIDLADALARHDSTSTLVALDCLITTGPTGTNLNHVAVLLVT